MAVNNERVRESRRDLVERFEAAYNRADAILRETLSKDSSVTFNSVVEDFADRRKFWPDKRLLKTAAELRNFIVHNKTKPYEPLAFPSETLVEELESAVHRLANPRKAIPTFQGDVSTIQETEVLANVLKTIAARNYSQFPVYRGSTFRSLLTENGITRWLARHVSRIDSLIELSDATVATVLEAEEKRKNWAFITPATTIDEIRSLFAENSLLEAVLITANRKETEKLLGIATRWDMLRQ